MSKSGRPKSLIYPEARNESSRIMKGKNPMPSQFMPSENYKQSVLNDLLARIGGVGSHSQEMSSLQKEASDARKVAEYDAAAKIRSGQKALDSASPRFVDKGKINAADKLIENLGFEKIAPVLEDIRPSTKFSYLQKSTGKILPGLAILGALGASDMASAAADIAVPGGVEELGVSPEQRDLDRRYKERIRQLQERKK